MSHNLCVVGDFQTAAAMGWDSMLGRGAYYCSSEWQGSLAELRGSYVGFALSTLGNQLRSGLVMSVIEASGHPLVRPDTTLVTSLGRQDVADETRERLLPTLSLGGQTPGTTQFLSAPSVTDDAEYVALFDAHLQLAEREAAERELRTVSLPFVEDARLRAVLRERGYIHYSEDEDNCLELDGCSSFDDYVARLPNARSREQVRRDRRRIDESGWTFSVEHLEDAPIDDIVRLQAINADRYGVDGGTAAARRKQELVMKYAPGRSWVAVGRDPDGAVGACSIFIRWRDELYSRQGGVDQALTRGVPIFFETCFYQLIEHAIDTDGRVIYYSVQAADAKSRRGCTQTPKDAWLHCVQTDDKRWLVDLLGERRRPSDQRQMVGS